MGRLVDFGYPSVNEAFDALPFAKRLAIIRLRFDQWVRGNGSMPCSAGCGNRVREIGGACGCNRDALELMNGNG